MPVFLDSGIYVFREEYLLIHPASLDCRTNKHYFIEVFDLIVEKKLNSERLPDHADSSIYIIIFSNDCADDVICGTAVRCIAKWCQ